MVRARLRAADDWDMALLCVTLLCAALDEPCTADLCGRWSGHWEDCLTGHNGPLRATFTPCGDCRYRVVFSGRFFAVLPFRYAVTLDVVGREGDAVLLAGESQLPFFGTFTYRASATACRFVADYSSCRYQGRFVLCR